MHTHTLFFTLVLGVLFSATVAYAQGTNCRTVTAAEVTAGFPVGSVRCDSDRAVVPQVSIESVNYLLSRLVEPHRSQRPYYITNLNPGFATCLAQFMQDVESKGIKMEIFSGARNEEDQRRAISQARPGYAAAVGKSPHQRGIAADLKCNGSSSCAPMVAQGATIESIAQKHGLDFPLLPGKPRGSRIYEPWHIEPARSECSTIGFSPTNATNGSSATTAPGNGIISRLLSGLTGGNQCQQLSTQCTSGNSTACMQYAQQCSQGQNPAVPSLPTPPTGSSQGTSGISTAYTTPPQQETVTVTPPAQTSPATTTTSTATSTTSIHILEQIAVSTDIATTTATTSRPLGTTTITLLAQEQARLSDTTNTVPVPSTGTTDVFLPSLPSDSTFTSPPPTQTGAQSTFSASRALSLLAEAQRILENLLLFVQPFSLTRHETSLEEYTDEDFLRALEDLEAATPHEE